MNSKDNELPQGFAVFGYLAIIAIVVIALFYIPIRYYYCNYSCQLKQTNNFACVQGDVDDLNYWISENKDKTLVSFTFITGSSSPGIHNKFLFYFTPKQLNDELKEFKLIEYNKFDNQVSIVDKLQKLSYRNDIKLFDFHSFSNSCCIVLTEKE